MLYTSSSFEPAVVEHIPGVMNSMSDTLSRLSEPGAAKTLPATLTKVPRARVPLRVPAYYLTLAPRSSGG